MIISFALQITLNSFYFCLCLFIAMRNHYNTILISIKVKNSHTPDYLMVGFSFFSYLGKPTSRLDPFSEPASYNTPKGLDGLTSRFVRCAN